MVQTRFNNAEWVERPDGLQHLNQFMVSPIQRNFIVRHVNGVRNTQEWSS